MGERRDILVETRSKGDTAATVAVASISDQDWYISRTHGVYHIPACVKAGPQFTGQVSLGDPFHTPCC